MPRRFLIGERVADIDPRISLHLRGVNDPASYGELRLFAFWRSDHLSIRSHELALWVPGAFLHPARCHVHARATAEADPSLDSEDGAQACAGFVAGFMACATVEDHFI